MSNRSGTILFLLFAAAFLILNRAAYQGYFKDDDMMTLGWTHWGPASAFLKATLNPLEDLRAVGFLYYYAAEKLFGMDYPKYVAVLHAFHLLNVWLIWLLVRRVGAVVPAASAACAFFGLHMALFDAIWKPMFVFDVLCATFCLLSIVLWARGNWILSLLSFWLAYKSKELAVMLPLVLVCYESWFGKRQWTRLAPFLVVSFGLGLRSLAISPARDADYIFHFTPAALARTCPFYLGQVFMVPYLGLLLPVGAALARNRRTWFGMAMMGLFFFPLLWLPGRVLSPYCYLPFAGLAVALSGMAEAAKPVAIAVFFLLWLPWDLYSLHTQQNDALRMARDAREWVITLARFAANRPAVAGFVYYGMPEGFHDWGMEGAAKYYFRRVDIIISSAATPEGGKLRQQRQTAVLNWDEQQHKLEIQMP